jgi:uncharacterized tellurite resistance protein B-like protein
MSLSKDFQKMFDEDEVIIANDLKFKAALGIGEQAFKSMKLRENLSTFSEALGVGTAVAGVANTVTIGSFLGFSTSGLLGTGLLASATTPGLNVIVAAGVISAGAYVGISRLLTKCKDSKVMVVPKFINTPLDLLATSLAGFFIPLGLKIGLADGILTPIEEKKLKRYLMDEWGYAETFIEKVIHAAKTNGDLASYNEIICSFSEFIKQNEDCDEKEIISSIMRLLQQITEADGMFHEKEEIEISYVKQLLNA